MLDTVEVRWICSGPLPAPVEQWFGSGRSLPVEARTDRYVVMRGCPWLGIKLRDDEDGPVALDVKAAHGEPIELRLTRTIRGRAAAWSKWTLGLDDRGAIVAGLDGTTPTLTAHKRRRRRRLVPDGPPRELSPDADVEAACDVELTTIALDGLDGRWWSLGFEAFGPPDERWTVLESIATELFTSRKAPPDVLAGLGVRDSTAYPGWLLERLAATDGA